ncbi:hypothetical protein [Polymorphum gilvum]|uniref:Lipoprotein n=1 Tax=Polymorphum gilvum (strain LMG 25793 / CGMCC 1.9160 / SL003B-26A1) TaxID=991905 RepID=F2J540_POLGS|nr:hypothetical protein [Polymorphum gilvum]ADZ70082.1 hypothetical protein SL003B_1654 [Polymorphum gilvum SL003B-26A1]
MRSISIAATAAACLALAACAYKAETISTPAYNVPLSYTAKIGGKWLLAVDTDRFSTVVRSSGMQCAAHNYPLDLKGSFETSVRQTLENVFQDLEVVEKPVPADQLAARGARGMISIRGEDIRGRLDVIPGFFTSAMRTRVELATAVTVDGRRGRLLGVTVDGDAEADGEAGFACEGGSRALAEAAGQAMRDNLRAVAEALGNASQLR